MSEQQDIDAVVNSEPQYSSPAQRQRREYELPQQQPWHLPYIPPRRNRDFRSLHYTRRSQNH